MFRLPLETLESTYSMLKNPLSYSVLIWHDINRHPHLTLLEFVFCNCNKKNKIMEHTNWVEVYWDYLHFTIRIIFRVSTFVKFLVQQFLLIFIKRWICHFNHGSDCWKNNYLQKNNVKKQQLVELKIYMTVPTRWKTYDPKVLIKLNLSQLPFSESYFLLFFSGFR